MKFNEQDQRKIIPALKVIGEPNRLRILCGLGMACLPVVDIINATGLGQTNVSFHLRVLREAGFVRAERRGAFIFYCLADRDLLQILQNLKLWLETRVTANPNKENQQLMGEHNSATTT
jgi:ArsR family transcriptional regulator